MKMKTLILIALCTLSVVIVRGQNSTYIDKGLYVAQFIMPDASIQNIYLMATDEGKKEFFRVANENIMQTEKVALRQKVLNGTTLYLSNTPSISERNAYRFLANKLCESCGGNTLSKSNTTLMVLKTSAGRKNILEVYWWPEKGWTIHVLAWDEVIGGKMTLDWEYTNVLIY